MSAADPDPLPSAPSSKVFRGAAVPGLRAIRVIALIEALKGVLVLLAGFGLLALLHRDVGAVAQLLVEHAHLNPAAHYPRIFIEAASGLGDQRVLLLALGALAYSALRLAEAAGLYFQKTWAQLLSALSGAIYVPFELVGLMHAVTWHGVLFLVINLLVVAIMVRALRVRRARQQSGAGAPPAGS